MYEVALTLLKARIVFWEKEFNEQTTELSHNGLVFICRCAVSPGIAKNNTKPYSTNTMPNK